MLVALLARGHMLVEGVPGLAKTMAIKTLAQAVGGEFRRIQFTPDLVPADLVGRVSTTRRPRNSTSRWAGVCQPAACGRDQPCACQSAKRAARSHAGKAGDDRRETFRPRTPSL